MKDEATHILKIGEKQTVCVRLVGPIGKKDGVAYYHAIPTIRTKLFRQGIHWIGMVPETKLTRKKRKAQ